MNNLQDDADSSHHPIADGTSFLTGRTGVSAPDGTHPCYYNKGKKANDMKSNQNNGIIGG